MSRSNKRWRLEGVLVVAAFALVGALVAVGTIFDGSDGATVDQRAGALATPPSSEPTIVPVPTSPASASPAPTSPASTSPASTSPVVADDCRIGEVLRLGTVSAEVACLETALAVEGFFEPDVVDDRFDTETDAAVRAYQGGSGLAADGVVGPRTARALGIWVGPPRPDPSTCAAEGRSVVVDREFQRAWFCDAGVIDRTIPITSAWSQPDPGSYDVYAKDLNASSSLTAVYSTMTHFVAFTYGKVAGARIAFHSVPKTRDGAFVQELDTVGDLDERGNSEGCIRVLPDDAVAIWDWLSIGDEVRVIS
jgi:peptidoglycan hydrolase-like protein with peptidoglycan-binding domain